jgi:hypothetical protein
MKNKTVVATGVIGKINSILESKTRKALRRIIEETDAARPADDADPAELAVSNLTEAELAIDDSTVTLESEDNIEMSDEELDELMSEESDDEQEEEVDEAFGDEDDEDMVSEEDDEEDEDLDMVDESDDKDDEDEAEMKAEARRRALRARRSGR